MNSHFYAWIENGETLGICGYEVHGDKVEIHLIAVDENTRSRGIGGAMITALQERYCKNIEAETDDDAVEFYRKRGFETIEFIHEKRGKRYTCLLRI
jgi:ribosomal protein S18 acetylase RimI-like enzyme